jgi:hypothetical protein
VQYSEAQARLDKSVRPSTAAPTLGRGSLMRSQVIGNSFTPQKYQVWSAIACEAFRGGLPKP